MAEISKAELAELLEISRPRVSQYLQQGLPVLASGRIEREAGLNWIAKNVVGPAHERAKQLLAAPPIPPGFGVLEKISNPADAALVLGLLTMMMKIRALATLGAFEAGASREQAERAGQVTCLLFVNKAEAFLQEIRLDIPGGMFWPAPDLHDAADLDAVSSNWHAPAKG